MSEKQNNNKHGGLLKRLIDNVRGKINTAYTNYEEKRARRDIIFTETITPAPAEKPVETVRGGIDIKLLLTVLALIVFGAVMSFSASYVYAEQEYGDSAYFFKRYIFFAIASIAVTAFFVVYFTPRLWKMFGTLTAIPV